MRTPAHQPLRICDVLIASVGNEPPAVAVAARSFPSSQRMRNERAIIMLHRRFAHLRDQSGELDSRGGGAADGGRGRDYLAPAALSLLLRPSQAND